MAKNTTNSDSSGGGVEGDPFRPGLPESLTPWSDYPARPEGTALGFVDGRRAPSVDDRTPPPIADDQVAYARQPNIVGHSPIAPPPSSDRANGSTGFDPTKTDPSLRRVTRGRRLGAFILGAGLVLLGVAVARALGAGSPGESPTPVAASPIVAKAAPAPVASAPLPRAQGVGSADPTSSSQEDPTTPTLESPGTSKPPPAAASAPLALPVPRRERREDLPARDPDLIKPKPYDP
ncbi:hypothetical protein [Pendulispora albinea]|uniref:Uncharacterized protein n=1 Tax=Pendulispora albinea TaxID=2741071 RepID=A0ABZ2LL58_9BACT